MHELPPGPAQRRTLLVRVRRGPYAELAARREQLAAELGRDDVSLCDALEAILSENERLRQKEATAMTLKIDDDLMSSPDTPHVAVRITITSWLVTWLRRDMRVTRNQAITAMTIASVVGATENTITRKDPIWPHVNSWASELGLDGESAISYATEPRKWEP